MMMKLYDIELDEMYGEMRCVVTLDTRGVRSGYVGIPEGHILYGLECERGIHIADCMGHNQKICIEEVVDIKHEIGFAEGGKDSFYPVSSDMWWFGFNAIGEAIEVKEICNELVNQLYVAAKHNWRVVAEEPEPELIPDGYSEQSQMEKELVKRYRAGDQVAYQQLEKIYENYINTVIFESGLVYEVDRELATDTAKELFRTIVSKDFDLNGNTYLNIYILHHLRMALAKIVSDLKLESIRISEQVGEITSEDITDQVSSEKDITNQVSSEKDIVKAVVTNLANELPDLERKFICRYYGLGEFDGQKAKSFNENSKMFGLTNYQAKKIANAFTKKLREKGVHIPG